MREHASRTKHYVIIARTAFENHDNNVNVYISLPGGFHSCEYIFFSSKVNIFCLFFSF